MNTSQQLARRLTDAVSRELPLLRELTEADGRTRPGGGPGWTRLDELGHLLDSATNNRARFIVAALQGSYTGPGYDSDGWVALGGYSEFAWRQLVDHWELTNKLLAAALSRIAPQRLQTRCVVSSAPAVTLEFLIDDYILHMQHHLDHLLGRKQLTEYPGASLGV